MLRDSEKINEKSAKRHIPIKVLFISHSSSQRGAEKSLLLLLKNIDRKVIQPTFISPSRGPIDIELKKINIKTYRVSYGKWISGVLPFLKFLLFLPTSIIQIYRIAKREQIDVIYSNTMVILQGGLVARMMGIPHVWHIREILENNPNLKTLFGIRNTHKMIHALSDKMIAISKSVAKPFLKYGQKVHIISNATEILSPENDRNEGDRPEYFPENHKKLFIGVVGDVIERKGQHIAVKAFEIVHKEIPNTEIVFAGNNTGKYYRYVKKLVTEKNLEKNVNFLGFVKEIEFVTSKFALTLVPSWEEPFGRITIESMASGIPVVGTNSGGTAEIIQDGYTGYLVPPGDHHKMAEKIICLLRDDGLRNQMGINCRKVVSDRYPPEHYAKQVTNVVRSCVAVN